MNFLFKNLSITLLQCYLYINTILSVHGYTYDENLFSDSLIVMKSTNMTIQSRMAAFGPKLEEGVNGLVIPMEMIDSKNGRYGCEVINSHLEQLKIEEYIAKNSGKTEGKNNSWLSHFNFLNKGKVGSSSGGYIALVERGQCSFSDKVRNMQRSGAKAVIVGNNFSELHLITMYANSDTSDIHIPAVFILQYDMLNLRSLVNDGDNGTTGIEVEMIESDVEWPVTDIFMMTTFLPLIFIIGIFIIYKFRMDTFDVMGFGDNLTVGGNGSSELLLNQGAAPPDVVYALPVKTFYKEKFKERDPDICAICIEDFKDEDELRVLPCRHEFHIACIDPWLITRKRFCPICKRSIIVDKEPDENTPLLNTNNSQNNTYYLDEDSSNIPSTTNSESTSRRNSIVNIENNSESHSQDQQQNDANIINIFDDNEEDTTQENENSNTVHPEDDTNISIYHQNNNNDNDTDREVQIIIDDDEEEPDNSNEIINENEEITLTTSSSSTSSKTNQDTMNINLPSSTSTQKSKLSLPTPISSIPTTNTSTSQLSSVNANIQSNINLNSSTSNINTTSNSTSTSTSTPSNNNISSSSKNIFNTASSTSNTLPTPSSSYPIQEEINKANTQTN